MTCMDWPSNLPIFLTNYSPILWLALIFLSGGVSWYKQQYTFFPRVAVFTAQCKKDHRMFSLWTRQRFKCKKCFSEPARLLQQQDKSSYSPFSLSFLSETNQLLLSVLHSFSYLVCNPLISSVLLPAFSRFNTFLIYGRTRLIDRLTWGKVVVTHRFVSGSNIPLVFFFQAPQTSPGNKACCSVSFPTD